MAIKLKGKRVAVEKSKKQQSGSTGGLIMPEGEEFTGTIVYVGEDADKSLQVGQKVYFSTNYQQSLMEGKNLCIMNDSEIFAIVE